MFAVENVCLLFFLSATIWEVAQPAGNVKGLLFSMQGTLYNLDLPVSNFVNPSPPFPASVLLATQFGVNI